MNDPFRDEPTEVTLLHEEMRKELETTRESLTRAASAADKLALQVRRKSDPAMAACDCDTVAVDESGARIVHRPTCPLMPKQPAEK